MIATYDPEEDEQQARGFRQKEINATLRTLNDMFSSMPKVNNVAPRPGPYPNFFWESMIPQKWCITRSRKLQSLKLMA